LASAAESDNNKEAANASTSTERIVEEVICKPTEKPTIFSDDQIRLAILKVLHKNLKNHPITEGIMTKEQFAKEFTLPENEMEYNMWYLEQKHLIGRTGFHGDPIWTAKISALGVDAVEHKELFADKLPFTQATINIAGNVYGNVVQATNSTVTFSQQVTDAFKQAIDQVEKKVNLVPESKEEILSNLSALEKQLKEPIIEAGKVQQTWNWIKENAVWVVPTLTEVVINGLKIALGIPCS
jgi:hypothetical protein